MSELIEEGSLSCSTVTISLPLPGSVSVCAVDVIEFKRSGFYSCPFVNSEMKHLEQVAHKL